ncbi:MAG TPA: cysteine--tRNA ligase, partial [Burkholderiales bacterium]|nr:cysteine--tRNA ligase [Burkholderiales bacterium]
VAFDMVKRWLSESGYRVTYVRNITDIDDKIIRRAAENDESIDALTARFIRAMQEDAAALGALAPDHEPRATGNVPQMLALIETLIRKGTAYQADNGDVFYSVHRFSGYGKLSGKSLDELRAGERVEVDRNKREPLDFVLWKAAKPGEPAWESPWGKGRPGWHIECSAMSERFLGEHFDIHGGGQDLQFPHHENEIAQSEGAHGHKFVNYWMHNGFVRVDDEKMSKSLGNFFTVREVLARFDPEVVRFFILRAHYRSPLNYSDRHLEDAKQALTRLYIALKDFGEKGEPDWSNPLAQRFREAMDDDFNTPEAFAVLFELANEVNRTGASGSAALLRGLASILGLLERDANDFLQGRAWDMPTKLAETMSKAGMGQENASCAPSKKEIEAMIEKRAAARHAKNFAESDRIRDELLAAGVVLEDGPSGTSWRKK